MLKFTLLGQVLLVKNGQPLSRFRSQKEAALLIYLAQTGETHPREFIAELLWDGRTTQQSLSNLRTVLTRLRKRVGDALLITRKSLALAPESRQQVDSVILLQTLAELGQIDTPAKAGTLQKALDTYQDDFLADFDLPAAPNFEQWMLATRAHIRQQVIAAYAKLGHYVLSTGDVAFGIEVVQRWLQVDALDEAAHTLLMRLQIKQGKVQEAAAHYAHVIKLLKTELNAAPSAEMTALIQHARSQPIIRSRQATTAHHNLPAAYDQFFGRKNAQQEIHVRLDQPWCRLVTIVGQGGVGKTRLATTIARSRLSQYRDGVWLVDLTEIDPADDDLAEAIAIEIATILDLRLSGSAAPIAQLLSHLQHKQMLLMLDNFENLLAGRQIVLDIVERCENVQLLITSREALKIRAEWTIALRGLSYSTNDTDDMPSDAVELFAARRAQQQRGTLTAAELIPIHAICRMVEGLPLAIELAAALTRSASCQVIADQLRDGFAALVASLHDVPHRHSGLHIVFEMSWRTLTPTLQQLLARLSLFAGGFTQTAAQQIAEADVQHLVALGEKSLLIQDVAAERCRLHAVVRAYAAEKRPFSDDTPQKHAHYYLTLLAQHTGRLQKEAPQRSVAVIQPDIDNVRLAWQTGLAQRYVDLLSAALTPLSIYYQLRGLAREGKAVMHTTFNTALTWGSAGSALAIRAGLERARFQNRLGQYWPVVKTIQTVLQLAAQGNDRWAQGMGQVLWGEALWRLGEYDLAVEKLTHALTIARAIDSTLLIGWCHHHLGVIDDIQSRYTAAHDHLQQACVAWQTTDNAQALSNSLNSIGLVCYHQGDLHASQHAMEQALTLCNQIDNYHLQALLLNNLSIIATEQGDYMGAQYYLHLGLELANTNGNLTGKGEIYTNLGRNYRLLGETELAVASLEHGLRIAESIDNRSLIATTMINLADTKREQGEPKRAEYLYRQALKIARQDDLQHTECEVLIGIAELLSESNKEHARYHSAEAVALAEDIQNPRLLKLANAIDQNLNVPASAHEENLSV
ncbi:MAG: tetratricopeptide repeat protein [Anaerolineales bacterium]|nr:tetratricopeptide repeat protein [Anaerolineales bacterium]